MTDISNSEPVPATNQAGEVELGPLFDYPNVAHDGRGWPIDADGVAIAARRLATHPATSQEGEAVVGDRVRIRDDVRRFGGRIGTVERFHEESISQCPIELRLDDGSSYCFRANEIERLAANPTPPTLSEDTTQTFDLVWTAAARPPVHPEPMTGRQTFTSFERAMRFMGNQPDDAQFVSLHGNLTRRYDRSDDARAALAQVKAS